MEAQNKDCVDAAIKAKALMRSAKYEEALKIYHDLWSRVDAEYKKKISGDVVSCLWKLKRYASMLTMYREYLHEQELGDFTKNCVAWAAYYHLIKNTQVLGKEEMVGALDLIHSLTDQSRELNPMVLSVLHLLKKRDAALDPNLRLQILDLLDRQLLSKNPGRSPNREDEYPSPLEEYLVHRSIALSDAKMYGDTAKFCAAALESFSAYHYHQDVWMRRRMAAALAKLKLYEQAIREMELVARKKRDWFIDLDLAEIYCAKEDYSQALRYAIAAALKTGKPEMKKKLWELMIGLYTKLDKPEEASLSLKLSLSICHHNKWRIAPELSRLANAFKLDPSSLAQPKKYLDSLLHLIPGSKPMPHDGFKKAHGSSANPQKNSKGTFLHLLPHGRSGFIKTDSGSIYFKVQDLSFPREELVRGMPLIFEERESYDPVKELKSKIAVKISKA